MTTLAKPRLRRACGGITKATIGQRVFWLECGLDVGHAGRHHNAKRGFYWDELFYFDEFEWYGKEKIAKPRKPKGWATTKDVLVKRGAKQDVLQQHREAQKWAFLQRPAPIQPEDPDAYYGAF